jgi:hyperosmotically inducible periplasmic protein
MKLKTLIAFLLVLVLAAPALTAGKFAISDDALFDQVRRKLASDPVVKGGTFDVGVKDGVVTLRGKVETRKQKDRATKVTKKVKGVRSVENQLTISTR